MVTIPVGDQSFEVQHHVNFTYDGWLIANPDTEWTEETARTARKDLKKKLDQVNFAVATQKVGGGIEGASGVQLEAIVTNVAWVEFTKTSEGPKASGDGKAGESAVFDYVTGTTVTGKNAGWTTEEYKVVGRFMKDATVGELVPILLGSAEAASVGDTKIAILPEELREKETAEENGDPRWIVVSGIENKIKTLYVDGSEQEDGSQTSGADDGDAFCLRKRQKYSQEGEGPGEWKDVDGEYRLDFGAPVPDSICWQPGRTKAMLEDWEGPSGIKPQEDINPKFTATPVIQDLQLGRGWIDDTEENHQEIGRYTGSLTFWHGDTKCGFRIVPGVTESYQTMQEEMRSHRLPVSVPLDTYNPFDELGQEAGDQSEENQVIKQGLILKKYLPPGEKYQVELEWGTSLTTAELPKPSEDEESDPTAGFTASNVYRIWVDQKDSLRLQQKNLSGIIDQAGEVRLDIQPSKQFAAFVSPKIITLEDPETNNPKWDQEPQLKGVIVGITNTDSADSIDTSEFNGYVRFKNDGNDQHVEVRAPYTVEQHKIALPSIYLGDTEEPDDYAYGKAVPGGYVGIEAIVGGSEILLRYGALVVEGKTTDDPGTEPDETAIVVAVGCEKIKFDYDTFDVVQSTNPITGDDTMVTVTGKAGGLNEVGEIQAEGVDSITPVRKLWFHRLDGFRVTQRSIAGVPQDAEVRVDMLPDKGYAVYFAPKLLTADADDPDVNNPQWEQEPQLKGLVVGLEPADVTDTADGTGVNGYVNFKNSASDKTVEIVSGDTESTHRLVLPITNLGTGEGDGYSYRKAIRAGYIAIDEIDGNDINLRYAALVVSAPLITDLETPVELIGAEYLDFYKKDFFISQEDNEAYSGTNNKARINSRVGKPTKKFSALAYPLNADITADTRGTWEQTPKLAALEVGVDPSEAADELDAVPGYVKFKANDTFTALIQPLDADSTRTLVLPYNHLGDAAGRQCLNGGWLGIDSFGPSVRLRWDGLLVNGATMEGDPNFKRPVNELSFQLGAFAVTDKEPENTGDRAVRIKTRLRFSGYDDDTEVISVTGVCEAKFDKSFEIEQVEDDDGNLGAKVKWLGLRKVEIEDGDEVTKVDTLRFGKDHEVTDAGDTGRESYHKIALIKRKLTVGSTNYCTSITAGTHITIEADGPDGAKINADVEDGTDGADGTPGEPGTPGADGADGSNGADGTPGTPGTPGEPGEPGSDGEPGTDGTDGADGTPGTPGTPGEPGADGTDGADGTPGTPGSGGADGTNFAINDTLYSWQANEACPSTAPGPLGATAAADGTSGYNYTLDYNDDDEQYRVLAGVCPRRYQGRKVSVRICWISETEISGDVLWAAQINGQQVNTDSHEDYSSWGSVQTAVAAVATADVGFINYTDILLDPSGTPTFLLNAGERFMLAVKRIGDDALDTMTGDARILSVELAETAEETE